jgi:RNA polymerase sigma-32 factor
MAHVDDLEVQRANARFIRRSMRAPMLTREHEAELARRWREAGDEAALHELIAAYGRLVVSAAARFRGYGLPLGDLIQEGHVGLMQAAARFEAERGVRFSTYAGWWIRSAMQDFILRNWSIVRTGTTAAQKSLFFNLRRLRARLADPSGGGMSPEQRLAIAEALHVSPDEVAAMEQRLSGADQSLNATLAEDSEEQRQDFIPDERPGPEEVVIGMRDARTRSRWLNEALAELTDRERRIIAGRQLAEQGATLEQLGQLLGVSKERVRQLEHRALGKLRQSLRRRADLGDDDFRPMGRG